MLNEFSAYSNESVMCGHDVNADHNGPVLSEVILLSDVDDFVALASGTLK